MVNTAFAGQSTGLVFEGEKRFDLMVRLNNNQRKDIEDVKKFINSVSAIGGGDFPEDVVGGMRKCLD